MEKKREKIFALVDCNAFFCSCEKLFRPDLAGRPVGVLSNNDGCFVSRTKELKALGVKMADPYFKVKDICDYHNVAVFSSNFSLYTNLSDRVMTTLTQFTPNLEVYSVDEAFLDLTGMEHFDLEAYAREIKRIVERDTGIPVSIGVAPTKALAKVANHLGKRSDKARGVVVLMDKKLQDIALEKFPVEDLWGIGRKQSVKLHALGIRHAKKFRDFKNERLIQKIFTKLGRQIQDELRGISCYELNQEIERKKEIMCSRTFGGPVFDLNSLRESVANYATNACEKMRKQDSLCAVVEVFFRTNPFKDTQQYYAYNRYKMQTPTSDTRKVIKYAFKVLDELFKHGYEYKKAGVRLSKLSDHSEYQLGLFERADDPKSEELMKVIDAINRREGPGTIKSMACGVDKRAWYMKQTFKSPRYVTGFHSLPRIP